jgi:hypothetical protein
VDSCSIGEASIRAELSLCLVVTYRQGRPVLLYMEKPWDRNATLTTRLVDTATTPMLHGDRQCFNPLPASMPELDRIWSHDHISFKAALRSCVADQVPPSLNASTVRATRWIYPPRLPTLESCRGSCTNNKVATASFLRQKKAKTVYSDCSGYHTTVHPTSGLRRALALPPRPAYVSIRSVDPPGHDRP